MINLLRVPQDCSPEKLFPDMIKIWDTVSQTEPLGYAWQYAGNIGYLKIPFWDTTLDPCEDNIIKSDGTIDHDFYICLCKWVDNCPISVRYHLMDLQYKK